MGKFALVCNVGFIRKILIREQFEGEMGTAERTKPPGRHLERWCANWKRDRPPAWWHFVRQRLRRRLAVHLLLVRRPWPSMVRGVDAFVGQVARRAPLHRQSGDGLHTGADQQPSVQTDRRMSP